MSKKKAKAKTIKKPRENELIAYYGHAEEYQALNPAKIVFLQLRAATRKHQL